MNFTKITLFLSAPRINRYLQTYQNDQKKAEQLYKANLHVSQAFHPTIGILEVVLRNQINTVLTNHFSDPDWIINQKTGFMSHSSLTYYDKLTKKSKTNDALKRDVEKAEKRIKDSQCLLTSGKVIAESMLGFWTQLFEVHYYKILVGKPIQIFNHLPSGYGRKEVVDLLTKIRLFRNRINHNEPICFKSLTVDFTETEFIHDAVFKLLFWIDTDLEQWVRDIDEIKLRITNAKSI